MDGDIPSTFLLNNTRLLFDGLIHVAVKFKKDSNCKFNGKCPKVGMVFR